MMLSSPCHQESGQQHVGTRFRHHHVVINMCPHPHIFITMLSSRCGHQLSSSPRPPLRFQGQATLLMPTSPSFSLIIDLQRPALADDFALSSRREATKGKDNSPTQSPKLAVGTPWATDCFPKCASQLYPPCPPTECPSASNFDRCINFQKSNQRCLSRHYFLLLKIHIQSKMATLSLYTIQIVQDNLRTPTN